MQPDTSALWARRATLCALLLSLVACQPSTAPEARPASSPPPAPSAAPTAVVPPAQLLDAALAARAIGDDDTAADELHALLSAAPQAPEAAQARLLLAESFGLRGRWGSAIEALRGFLASSPPDDLAARAELWLARSYAQTDAHAEALAAYQRYRARKTALEPYARLYQAAQEQALGQIEAAATSYEAAATSDLPRPRRAAAYELAIALRRQLDQPQRALDDARALLDLATNPAYRARALAEAADLAAIQGDQAQARAWQREAVALAPATDAALAATQQLLADPAGALDPALAAEVLATHQRYDDALPQYDAAIAAASGEPALELRRRRALALRAAGDNDAALAELAAIGAAAPNSAAGRQAQLDWVQTRGQAGETQAAIDGYRVFAQAYPDDPQAAEALARAALLLERQGDPAGAAQQRLELGQRYPNSDQAGPALDDAGRFWYSAGQHDAARQAWELQSRSGAGIWAARGAFWAALVARQSGDTAAAEPLLARALEAAPDSYYGARASEILGRAPLAQIPIGAPTSDAEWRAAEAWIASWTKRPAPQGVAPAVAGSVWVTRALALAEAGLTDDATDEWRAALDEWRDQPELLYGLARISSDQQVAFITTEATAALLALAPPGPLPTAIRRLQFPTPYAALVTARAKEYEIDPRAVYALLRQESGYNPAATSWVGARGLAQVMPATGQAIARNLGLESFDEADLYRPAVGVRFGAYYLSRQVAASGGSLVGGLAAYNGGPGNVQRWAGGDTISDPDEFVEAIDYPETATYVKLVYGYYGAYQQLYSAAN